MTIKISQLPSATPPDGTELVPIVQGGVTKQTLISELLASSLGSSLVGYSNTDLTPASGPVNLSFWIKKRPLNLYGDFGADGGGTADDTIPFQKMLANSTGRVIQLGAGTFKLTSLLSYALTNCEFIGTPGATTITGNFGYATLKLLALNNVFFYGIIFESTYTNAVEDTHYGVVYSSQTDVKETVFERCYFTSPNANTNGLSIFARTAIGDTSAVVDGLWVEDCTFTNIGRMGITVMNRSTVAGGAADALTATKRVYINRNKSVNTGLSGSYGMFISLDGGGSQFSVSGNRIENPLTCGIESQWSNGEINENVFATFTRANVSPIFVDLQTSGFPTTGITVAGNKTETPATLDLLISDTNGAIIHGNMISIQGANAGPTMEFLRATNCRSSDNIWGSVVGSLSLALVRLSASYGNSFDNDSFINGNTTTGRSALLVSGASYGNEFNNCTFDDSASSGHFSTVRFTDAGTTNNNLKNCKFNAGAGGYIVDEISSAAGNSVIGIATSPTSPDLFGYKVITMPDSAYTAKIQDCATNGLMAFGSAITADRTVTLPATNQTWQVQNGTSGAHNLVFTCGGGTNVTLGNAKTCILRTSAGGVTARITADV